VGVTKLTQQASPVGALVIIGFGITAVSHVTPEARERLRNADVVFYNPTSELIADYIRQQNTNTVDLSQLYGESKRRRITYVQMAELMLREVRKGRSVVGAFPGHAGFFNMTARRALAIAKDEGHATRMLPGISSLDCLVSDLRIDPGVGGLQILKAGLYLRGVQPLATWGHVVLIQVSHIGDATFSKAGPDNRKFLALIAKLITDYGPSQEALYYLAPIFPWLEPVIRKHTLKEWLDRELTALGGGILYLPAKGMTFDAASRDHAFQGGQPYDEAARQAIGELADAAPSPVAGWSAPGYDGTREGQARRLSDARDRTGET
jgi:precorrin-2 methylase